MGVPKLEFGNEKFNWSLGTRNVVNDFVFSLLTGKIIT